MKNKLLKRYLSVAVVMITFLSGQLFLVAGTVNAAESNENSSEVSLPDIVVRRQWISRYVQTFIGSSAPQTIYYSDRGFAGNLTKIDEYTDDLGTVGVYNGYVYNQNYPIPLSIKLSESSDQNDVVTSSNTITRTIIKKNVYDFEPTMTISNVSYYAKLTLEELWQNSNGTWTGVYKGTKLYNYQPLQQGLKAK